jgi:uncharacterized membrane protein
MTDFKDLTQEPNVFRAILHPHRSLSRRGFAFLMAFLGAISLVTGIAFTLIGAWPVLGFFGLDVLAVYVAFQINYRAGTAYEMVELTPELLKVTQVKPSGRSRSFDFNPYWVRVLVNEWPDGSAVLKLISHGHEFEIARFLNADEKKDFAVALQGALASARSAPMPG